MRKFFIFSILIFAVVIIQLPNAEAWTGRTHPQIVDQVYYSLPADAQQKLILTEMEKGSTAPDLVFFDYVNHRYPLSYSKAIYWLEKGQREYQAGDYPAASYSFGVASHYISDSMSAPHAVNKTGPYHSFYEIQAILLTPHITVRSGDLKQMMEWGTLQSQYSWNSWMMDRNSSHIQRDLNNAASACYVGICQYLN